MAKPTTSRSRRSAMTPNQRTRDRVRRAINRRVALIIELAPDLCCAECGEQFEDPRLLTVDHVDGITWNPRKLSQHCRIARYWREFLEGVPLRALCGHCNSSDGAHRGNQSGPYAVGPDEVPF